MRRLGLMGLMLLGGCAAASVAGRADVPAAAFDTLPGVAAPAGSSGAGGVLAQALCASCHAIGRDGDSPMRAAPPFRTLGVLYPVSDLQEAFAEGLVTAHPAMPAFEMQPDQIADLIAYLESVSGGAASHGRR